MVSSVLSFSVRCSFNFLIQAQRTISFFFPCMLLKTFDRSQASKIKSLCYFGKDDQMWAWLVVEYRPVLVFKDLFVALGRRAATPTGEYLESRQKSFQETWKWTKPCRITWRLLGPSPVLLFPPSPALPHLSMCWHDCINMRATDGKWWTRVCWQRRRLPRSGGVHALFVCQGAFVWCLETPAPCPGGAWLQAAPRVPWICLRQHPCPSRVSLSRLSKCVSWATAPTSARTSNWCAVRRDGPSRYTLIYSTVLHYTLLCCTLLWFTPFGHILLYSAAQYCTFGTALYPPELHCTLLYSIILYCTVTYCMLLRSTLCYSNVFILLPSVTFSLSFSVWLST